MEEYISSSEESSSSVSSAGGENIDDEIRGHSQNSNSKCLPISPGMQQFILEQPSLYRCSFCNFQARFQKGIHRHLVYHLTKSSQQCQLSTFSTSTVPELYLHIQHHHLMAGGKRIRVRSATCKCGHCDFVTKYKQELQRHEILHREKSNFRCELCSYSVSTSFCLTRNVKRHHSAHQNTPASIQEARVEPASPPTVSMNHILLQQTRTDPPTFSPEEAQLEEVRTGPLIPPPADRVLMQPVTLRKWRVESIKAPKIRGGNCLVPQPTEVVNRTVKGPIPARSRLAHRFITVFKASQRRKRNGLMPRQSQNTILKKLIKLKKKKSKLREADVYTSNSDKKKKEKLNDKKSGPQEMDAVVPGATGSLNDAIRKKTSSAQMDAESKQEEPVEPTSYNKRRPKLDGYEHKKVEYKCIECEFFTLHLDNMKSHKVRHDRKEKFQCDRCSYSARSKSRLSAHSNRFHREPPPALNFKCSDCEYSTLCWNKIKRRRLGHDRQEEFKCNRCSFSARLKRHLRFHSNRFHRDPPAALSEVKKDIHGDNEKLCSRIENM